MKSYGFLSLAAGALMLGLVGSASAAPVSTALPNLSTLSTTEGMVEQSHYRWRHWHHRRCHWYRHCNRWGCHWHRRCHW